MRISIKTLVNQDLGKVKSQFNSSLLEKLSPPFPKVSIKRFDGIDLEDQFEMELNFGFFKQQWKGKVTRSYEGKETFFFIDEGNKLPFFLKSWKHQHLLLSKNGKTEIVDNITFEGKVFPLTLLLYPAMYLQFLYRKPIYRRLFR
ncbi:hypothetical protein KI659_05665 [Litoribacter alkaliphilus]|uniref:Ligand-binding SRPBCC domain-containing protein n=1 Tax=Litoribacter ruber TaxID=702568 RepID=A0AAP2G0U9_9BACT|nr:hypothetical protein [Litoribacter alkaliphilus]MBS9523504.1 hypothetical protein [Litoribacter alkaliphilus]